MDNMNETFNESFDSTESKRRTPKTSSNNDFVIRLETSPGMQTPSILAKLVPVFTIGLLGITMVQCYQTKMLVDQNAEILEQLQTADQRYEQLLGSYGKTLDTLGESLKNINSQPSTQAPTENPTTEATTPVEEEEKAFLGVSVLQDESSKTVLGLRLYGVYEASPAYRAGLRAGDIIMDIDDVAIDSYETLSSVLDTKVPGDVVKVRYARTESNTVYFQEAEIELVSSLNFDLGEEVTEENP